MTNLQRSAAELSPLQSMPAAETKLEVSAQIISFEPGLYSVEIAAAQTVRGASGLVVPSVRLDPLCAGDHSRVFISTLSESNFIQPGGNATYLRVLDRGSAVLLTIYRLAGSMASPDLRITMVQPPAMRAPDRHQAAALASEPLHLLAHVERTGDVHVQGGYWAGQPGGRGAVEGFSIAPGGAIKPDDIEYQAVLGSDWMTPWLPGGEFCGSRGLSLPLLGIRIRLRGGAADMFSVSYWGSFVGGGEIGPLSDGAVCSGSGGPLEALRVVLKRRHAEPPPMTAPIDAPVLAPAASAAGPHAPPRAANGRDVGAALAKQAATPPAKPGKARAGAATPAGRSKLGRT